MPEYKVIKERQRTGNGYELMLWDDGDKSYYFNGRYHREDGPAFEPDIKHIHLHTGSNSWFLYGKQLDKEWFLKNPEKINEMKAYELFEPEELVRMKL